MTGEQEDERGAILGQLLIALWGATNAQELLDDLEEDAHAGEASPDDIERLKVLIQVKTLLDAAEKEAITSSK